MSGLCTGACILPAASAREASPSFFQLVRFTPLISWRGALEEEAEAGSWMTVSFIACFIAYRDAVKASPIP